MLREPLNAVKLRVELSAGKVIAQVVAAIFVLFTLIFAIPGAVLWYLHSESVRVALFAVAACFLAIALIALVAMLIISVRQRRARRQTNLSSALAAALIARPRTIGTVMHGGSQVLRIARRRPLLTLGGALAAGLLLTSTGSGRPKAE